MTAIHERILIESLGQAKEILDKYNIRFWLDCGTLLGAVREKTFLSWENDIDLGVLESEISDDLKTLLRKEFCNCGFSVYIGEDYINYLSASKGSIVVDINFYCITGDMAIMRRLTPYSKIGWGLLFFLRALSSPYYYAIEFSEKFSQSVRSVLVMICRTLPAWIRKHLNKIIFTIYQNFGSEDTSWVVPSHYFVDLTTVKFYSMEFRVPDQTEEYLAYRYGLNWQIPKKDWITAQEDGAVTSTPKQCF